MMPAHDRPLGDSLEYLAYQSNLLVRRSEDLNRLLAEVESALRSAKIHFEATVYEVVASQMNATEDGVEGYYVGFAQVYDEGWCLVLRPVLGTKTDPKRKELDFEPAGPDLVLRRASRVLRIAAVPKLGKLVEKVTKDVEERLGKFKAIDDFLPESDPSEDRNPVDDIPEEDTVIGAPGPDDCPF